MIFEDNISKKQKDMISLALELSESKADKIYIYGSSEARIVSFNCFFEKKNMLYTINKLPLIGVKQLSNDRMFAFLKIGSEDFKELLEFFKNDGKEIPTQIKIVYDVNNHKAKAQYSYEIFHSDSETVTPEEIFLRWYEEVKQEVERN